MVRLVGLTGGIGAGKSEALAALERLGAATLSSDRVVHEELGTDEVRDLLVERLGSDVAPDGKVDRAAVARLVFAREREREWLEALLWPRVAERIEAFRQALTARGEPDLIGVVEVPLLFEAGMADSFDATLAVVSESSEERAAQRGHAGVDRRALRQLAQAEKAARADHVVHNDGDLDELQARLSELLATLERE